MKLSLFLLLSLIFTGASAASYADNFEPIPHCYKPNKPLWLAAAYYKNRYNRDIEEYQRCMKAFIEDQERAIKMHTQAAQKALETWNNFAQEK